MGRRFGILTFPSGSFADIAAEWRWGESIGLDSAFLVDTLAKPSLVHFEAWVTLAALAVETSRLRIGTLVTILPLRHPALLAAQAISVDRISGGRLELGIGSGDDAGDLAAVGADEWSAADRIGRLGEQLALLDTFLRGGATSHAGSFYRTDAIDLAAPIQQPRPPLTVAAEGRASIALAARFADVWCSMGGQRAGEAARLSLTEAVARTEAQAARFVAACGEVGRVPATVRRCVLAFRTETDPLSSIDAFDEFVGRYAEVGTDDFVFYWPPLASLRRGEPVPSVARNALEQIAAARFGPSGSAP